jgi:hypothetical protein
VPFVVCLEVFLVCLKCLLLLFAILHIYAVSLFLHHYCCAIFACLCYTLAVPISCMSVFFIFAVLHFCIFTLCTLLPAAYVALYILRIALCMYHYAYLSLSVCIHYTNAAYITLYILSYALYISVPVYTSIYFCIDLGSQIVPLLYISEYLYTYIFCIYHSIYLCTCVCRYIRLMLCIYMLLYAGKRVRIPFVRRLLGHNGTSAMFIQCH